MHGVTEVCPECQFDPSAELDPVERFATFAKRYPVPLTRLLKTDSADVLRTRPDDTTWSALEYVGHMVGVCDTTVGWIERTIAEDEPAFSGSDVDEEIRLGQFNDVAPADMAARIAAAAGATSARLSSLEPDVLDRTASFGGVTAPLRLFIVAMIHEGHHHLLDVGRVLRTVRTQASEDQHSERSQT